MHRSISRRRFLRDTLAIGGGMAALGGLGPMAHLARAQQPGAPDRFYVFCYFGGGWDVLLGLDPRDPRTFSSRAEDLSRNLIQPGYELLALPDADLVRAPVPGGEMVFGPFIGDLARHAAKIAVIRGIDMETVAHQSGYRRFLTGKPPSGGLARGSAGATWLASHLGADQLIPQLSVGVESYNKNLPNYATALFAGGNNDLVSVLRPDGTPLPARASRELDRALLRAVACPDAAQSPIRQQAESARAAAANVVRSGAWRQFDFNAQTPSINALRDRFRLQSGGERNAAVAYQALTQGIARCVSVTMTGGLDTHGPEWANDQGPRQQSGFDAIARLADALDATEYKDGRSWLEHTVIVGFSEFSRTPLLNTNGGRDHHITTSCFLMGGGVRGGQAIGASSDVGMLATPTDLATGRPDPGGEVISPEHIWRTLFDEVGIPRGARDGPDLRVEPIGALLRA